MTIVEEGSGEAPEIEDGLYDLTVISAVTGIREGPDKYNPEIIDAPIVHINMAVGDYVDEDGKPIVLRSTMNLKFSRGGSYPPSTLYLYAVAFGVCPAQGTPFDTDWLQGKKAQGMIRTEEEGKWPRVVNESLIPAKKGSAQKAATKPQEARQAAEPPFDVDDDDDAKALSSWWAETRKQGITRAQVNEMSQALFEGKLPAELEPPGRAHLMEQLLIGV
jgi:hypothetical protein